MKITIAALTAAAALTAFAFHATGWAQAPRPSQHGSVSQQVGNTTITIEYNRPVARGRAHLRLAGALRPGVVPGRRQLHDDPGVDRREDRRPVTGAWHVFRSGPSRVRVAGR